MCDNNTVMSWRRFFIRATYGFALVCSVTATIGIGVLLHSKIHIFDTSLSPTPADTVVAFPVSVNAHTGTIEENPTVETFFYTTLANAPDSSHRWWNQVAAVFSAHSWYQNLASPVSRIVVIWPGERKEQATKNMGDILGWSTADKAAFTQLIDTSSPILTEGKYFPGQYVTHRDATPEDMQQLILNSFQTEVLSRYTAEVEAAVPLEDALVIASLLEREASDFKNMREVAGVIWNRLFIDMPLQLDASLQYVRGSDQYEPAWWPKVRPRDKYLASPYNTYQNAGLPPAPIANPSAEAILAALNPVVTECLYYFHTSDGGYHCSTTYKEHVAKLKEIYGRGS